MDHISSAFTSLLAGLFIKNVDYIIASSPQFFTAWAGFLLSKLKRRPWVFEVRDMWPEGIIFLKNNGFLYRFLEKIELFLYKDANKIVVVTEAFKKSIIQRSLIHDKKVKVIFNGSNVQAFSPKIPDIILRNQLNLHNKFIVGYAGTIGISQGLEFIFSEALKIKDSNIHFLFVGDGAIKSKLKDFVSQNSITNITMIDAVDKKSVQRYMSLFDVGIVPLRRNLAYLKVIPSKTFELAAMTIPILLGVDGEMRSILEKYSAGKFYEPEESISFQAAIMHMYLNRDSLLALYSEGLVRMKVDFDRSNQAKKMLEFIRYEC